MQPQRRAFIHEFPHQPQLAPSRMKCVIPLHLFTEMSYTYCKNFLCFFNHRLESVQTSLDTL